MTDARGSVTGLVQGEKITNTTHYSVFGRPTEKDDTGNPYGYTGEAQDVTGYHYLRARYYDSHSGTFLTQDSYEGEEDNPLSQNGYTYVENNPINYTDPTGHKKNWFQNVWSGIKKTASKVVNKAKQVVSNVYNTAKKVVSTVWNGVKQVASSVWNGVKQVASSVYSGVTNFARTAYNTVSNYFSGGGTNYWQPASANYSGYSYYSGYPVASGAPSSQSTLSYAQIQAIQTAQRQQRLTADYQKATGSKGKPKTKEGQNLLRNWGQSLKNTLTKFCRTSVKVVKDTAKTSVAFGVGTVIQIGENNLIKPVLDKLFGEWQPKEWIEEDPGYARGRRLGNILGFFQAAAEYVAAGAIFTGGNGLSIAGAPVSGGATLAGSAASTAAAAGVFTHATAVLGASVNSMMSGDNYGSGNNNSVNQETIKSNLGRVIDTTPAKKHYKVKKNPGPFGEPNSSVDILNSKGEVVTRRFYDKSGRAIRDVDMTNHGNSKNHPEYPHEHNWKYDSNGNPTRE